MPTRESVEETLRERGIRVTAPRLVVLQALQDGHGHLSAEDIHARVMAHYPYINLVTVYRTLETLETHGLAARAVLSDRVTRWEHTEQAHHHLVCRCCAAVVELDDAPFRRLAEELARTAGVRVDARHLALHGLCAGCALAGAPVGLPAGGEGARD